jgi:type IX secretion system PorP/SprF family membrane protein
MKKRDKMRRGKSNTMKAFSKWSILFVLLLWIFPSIGKAQQEAQYSQYMFNGLFINPAYAGSREQGSMNLIGRSQWTGFPGAPKSAAFSLHAPSANLNNGFGVVMSTDGIGPIQNTGLNAQYAYRIRLRGHQVLALGLSGGMDYYRTNFAGLRLEDGTDYSFAQQDIRKLLPNVGTGAYFSGSKGYLGISVPRLLNNSFSPTTSDSTARQSRHLFATAGLVLNLSEDLKFRPSTLVKYTKGGGPSLDLNASFLFKEKLWLGASWRSDDAMIFMVELWPTQQLRIGYAYDLTTSALRQVSTGSHELSLGFDFAFKKGKVVSPRYF